MHPALKAFQVATKYRKSKFNKVVRCHQKKPTATFAVENSMSAALKATYSEVIAFHDSHVFSSLCASADVDQHVPELWEW